MEPDDLARATDPSRFSADLRTALAQIPQGHEHQPGQLSSLRRTSHRGHEITVRTTYEVEVDGRPVPGAFRVSDRGLVLTHALPNYSFPSALDLVRQLIDSFPEDFPPQNARAPQADEGSSHGRHGGR